MQPHSPQAAQQNPISSGQPPAYPQQVYYPNYPQQQPYTAPGYPSQYPAQFPQQYPVSGPCQLGVGRE